jgi:hypothetical protein
MTPWLSWKLWKKRPSAVNLRCGNGAAAVVEAGVHQHAGDDAREVTLRMATGLDAGRMAATCTTDLKYTENAAIVKVATLAWTRMNIQRRRWTKLLSCTRSTMAP